MGIKEHAMHEFKLAGWLDTEDEMQQEMNANILELLEVMARQRHSGFSASFLVNVFNKLARYEILSPLTGEDDEWNKHTDGTWQNKRCSHVFKQGEHGVAFDTEAVIFYEEDAEGNKYHLTSRDSSRPVTFPYTPEKHYEKAIRES